MQDGAREAHEAGGTPAFPGRALDPRGHPIRRLTLFFGLKKANFWKNIWAKGWIQSELQISGYKRNCARAESGNAETERDRETDPISEGLSPLPRDGDQGPEGKPFSHLGRRSRKKKKKKKGALSPLLPVAPERCRGPSSSPQSTPTPPPSSPTSPSPSPFYIKQSTLPQPAVPSTLTWCFMLHIIIQWCVAILWCLSRFSLSYRWLMNCYDWFNLLVVMLLSYCSLRVAQAWGVPVVGCCNMFMIHL